MKKFRNLLLMALFGACVYVPMYLEYYGERSLLITVAEVVTSWVGLVGFVYFGFLLQKERYENYVTDDILPRVNFLRSNHYKTVIQLVSNWVDERHKAIDSLYEKEVKSVKNKYKKEPEKLSGKLKKIEDERSDAVKEVIKTRSKFYETYMINEEFDSLLEGLTKNI